MSTLLVSCSTLSERQVVSSSTPVTPESPSNQLTHHEPPQGPTWNPFSQVHLQGSLLQLPSGTLTSLPSTFLTVSVLRPHEHHPRGPPPSVPRTPGSVDRTLRVCGSPRTHIPRWEG